MMAGRLRAAAWRGDRAWSGAVWHHTRNRAAAQSV